MRKARAAALGIVDAPARRPVPPEQGRPVELAAANASTHPPPARAPTRSSRPPARTPPIAKAGWLDRPPPARPAGSAGLGVEAVRPPPSRSRSRRAPHWNARTLHRARHQQRIQSAAPCLLRRARGQQDPQPARRHRPAPGAEAARPDQGRHHRRRHCDELCQCRYSGDHQPDPKRRWSAGWSVEQLPHSIKRARSRRGVTNRLALITGRLDLNGVDPST